MKGIFVFADSFSTNTILFSLDYYLNQSYDNVCLLAENHDFEEPRFISGEKTVRLFRTVNECINESDLVVILQSDNTPLKHIKYTLDEVTIQNKNVIVISNPWNANIQNINVEHSDILEKMRDKPVIMLLSCGRASQLFCLESLISRIFAKKGIPITQYFSKETSDLLTGIYDYGYLNRSITTRASTTSDSSVIVFSYRTRSVNSLYSCIDLMRSIKPDIIIVQTDRSINVEEYKEIRNIIKYTCVHELDMLIRENYIYLEGLFNAYIKDDVDIEGVINIENLNLESIIEDLIFAKLTYPKDVIQI